ncbi:MAG: hypothetical protein ACREOW_07915 [Thermodesulfobacteriota bacterium]
MIQYNLFYYPYSSFTNAQLPLLKLAVLYFDKLVILDPVGASWDTMGITINIKKSKKNLIIFKEA